MFIWCAVSSFEIPTINLNGILFYFLIKHFFAVVSRHLKDFFLDIQKCIIAGFKSVMESQSSQFSKWDLKKKTTKPVGVSKWRSEGHLGTRSWQQPALSPFRSDSSAIGQQLLMEVEGSSPLGSL